MQVVEIMTDDTARPNKAPSDGPFGELTVTDSSGDDPYALAGLFLLAERSILKEIVHPAR